MVCFNPLKGYRAKRRNPKTGKYPIVFGANSSCYVDRPVLVPCGKCIGCLRARAFNWSVRCTCESYYFKEKFFFTFTYDKEHLPSDRNLCRAHMQNFFKLLRYYFPDSKIRYFYCGEYGEKRHRPHYHAIIYGLPIYSSGLKYFATDTSKRGNINYCCPRISKIWEKGRVTFCDFTPATAAYVAQYTYGKTSSKLSSYVSTRVVKPFIGSSQRPSIGYLFFNEFHTKIYERGYFKPFSDKEIIIRPIPYFNKLLEKEHKLEWFCKVEMPRRRWLAERYREYGLLYNGLFDRDSKALYDKERIMLRQLQPRDGC